MKYRIVSNGDVFRIQYRYWFWPFWIWAKELVRERPFTLVAPIEFERYIHAKEYLNKLETSGVWVECREIHED